VHDPQGPSRRTEILVLVLVAVLGVLAALSWLVDGTVG
jgi:hypothetical protein